MVGAVVGATGARGLARWGRWSTGIADTSWALWGNGVSLEEPPHPLASRSSSADGSEDLLGEGSWGTVRSRVNGAVRLVWHAPRSDTSAPPGAP